MRIYYSIGLLYKIFGDDSQCENYLKEVYRKCLKYLPEDDKKTSQIRSLLEGMNVNLNDNSESFRKPGQDKNEEGEEESLVQLGEDNDD
jgi:hypothetical protein